MAHHNTVFAQMLKFIPRHEFESLANQHHSGRRLRKMTRWTQFVAMATAQLSGRHSLRDVASNLAAQARKCYHDESRAFGELSRVDGFNQSFLKEIALNYPNPRSVTFPAKAARAGHRSRYRPI